jgi:hypothetical protein
MSEGKGRAKYFTMNAGNPTIFVKSVRVSEGG